MKGLLFTISIAFLLASCTGGAKRDYAKIKAGIFTYLTTGMDKKDVPKIDSISIISADTLTEKNCLKISLDRHYSELKNLNAIYDSKLSLIKADSALLSSMQQQLDLYRKHGEKLDDIEMPLNDQAAKMKTDTIQLNESRLSINNIKNSIDSMNKLYTNADSVTFFAYYVNAGVYFTGASSEQGNFIISKDWKVSR